MNAREGLLRAIVEEPTAEENWLILGDWLEEHDDPCQAELLRLHRKLLATCCEPELHPGRAEWQVRIVELLAAGVRPCLPHRTVALDRGVQIAFHFIPPGRFLVGSPQGETVPSRATNETLHRCCVVRASGQPCIARKAVSGPLSTREGPSGQWPGTTPPTGVPLSGRALPGRRSREPSPPQVG